ncbi:uncharacterized protein LOC142182156 [Nicotiana tabacum]|uniref:Uncharacterized protein LOC142182156 n=1 Tax=Nicotiana tabacum TaxID=4097 RepID=A0AC58URX8_TOBAC
MAEAKAILKRILLCRDRIKGNIIVESYSLFHVTLINNKLKPPWEIRLILEHIQEISYDECFTFVHIYREVNMVADMLANLGESLKDHVVFNSLTNCPHHVRAVVLLDREGIPNFRFKPKRNQFVVNDVSNG